MAWAAPTYDRRPAGIWAEVADGLPSFGVPGWSDRAVRGLRERLRAAIVNQGFEFPLARVTVSGLRGPRATNSEELAAAVAILTATGQVQPERAGVLVGALLLDGSVCWGKPERLAELRDEGRAYSGGEDV